MAATADVRDILELESRPDHEFVTKESLMNDNKKVCHVYAISVLESKCHGEEAVVLGTEELWQIFLFVIVQIPIFIMIIIIFIYIIINIMICMLL